MEKEIKLGSDLISHLESSLDKGIPCTDDSIMDILTYFIQTLSSKGDINGAQGLMEKQMDHLVRLYDFQYG